MFLILTYWNLHRQIGPSKFTFVDLLMCIPEMLPETFHYSYMSMQKVLQPNSSGSILPYVCDKDLSAHPFPRALKNSAFNTLTLSAILLPSSPPQKSLVVCWVLALIIKSHQILISNESQQANRIEAVAQYGILPIANFELLYPILAKREFHPGFFSRFWPKFCIARFSS